MVRPENESELILFWFKKVLPDLMIGNEYPVHSIEKKRKSKNCPHGDIDMTEQWCEKQDISQSKVKKDHQCSDNGHYFIIESSSAHSGRFLFVVNIQNMLISIT